MNEPNEREAFEQWVLVRKHGTLPLTKNGDTDISDYYYSPKTEAAWRAWQHQQKRIVELETEVSELRFECAGKDLHIDTLLNVTIESLQAKLNVSEANFNSLCDKNLMLEGRLTIAVNALEEGDKFINEISLLLVKLGVDPERIGLFRDSKLKIALAEIKKIGE